MITSIEIKGLYGLYDYKLNFLDENPVTIITGPNGFGKTTLLKIISYLYSCNFWYFCILPFHSLFVSFTDKNNVVSFIEMFKGVIPEHQTEVSEEMVGSGKELRVVYGQRTAEEDRIISDFILGERYYLNVSQEVARRSRRHSVYPGRYKGMDDEKLFQMYYNLKSDDIIQRKARNILMFFEDKQARFIQEQRCMITPNLSTVDDYSVSFYTYSIDEISDSLRQKFDVEQKNYAFFSQVVDSSFISRLLKQDASITISRDDYEKRVIKLRMLINRLKRYNLVSDIKFAEEDIEKYHDVLSLHLQDMELKLSSFNLFLKKLELFEGLVNKNVLSNKEIYLDNRGIVIKNAVGERVPLNKLSSGEQNLIILYYRMAFDTAPGSLLLIDEPENSLHMAWLENMLADYIQMAKQLGCRILVATHSPAFINGHWELTYDLFENNKQN